MIQLDRVEKSYGGRTLFRDLAWQLNAGRRIGLVGPNGVGKTTLFRLLTGDIEPDGGRVVIPRGVSVGLLPQEMEALADVGVLQTALLGRSDLLELEREMARLQRAVASAADPVPLTVQLGRVQERYEIGGGYSLRARASEILSGMGFSEADHERSASQLSGGWRMRLVLAQLLLQRPDVLLMDEPTNHLDLPSLEWLESFLLGYEGTVVVVSHDRYFLNRLVTEIASLDSTGFTTHPGNYDEYEAARELHIEQLRKTQAQQDRQIKQTQRFIERFRYKATKAKQVQSRVKQLEKLERVELPGDRRSVAFRFAEAPRPGRHVCQLERVVKRYGDVTVYDGLDLRIERGERVALVGPNGQGKSTLLKLMAEEVRADSGKVELGHNVLVGYFAQHQVEALDLSATVLEEMERRATLETRANCRSILGAFLFSGDDVDKRVSVLSGGERSRLALARMLLRPVNFLLLDEPTNHLDMVSRDVLCEALERFGGTLLFVSHDRRFINRLASRVIHVAGGRCISYPGDYEYYHYKRAEEVAAAAGEDGESEESAGTGAAAEKRERKRREAEVRNALYRRTEPLRKRLMATEAQIARREGRVVEIEEKMADPAVYEDAAAVRKLGSEHSEHKARLLDLYDKWAELSERIDMLEREVMEELELE